MSYTSFEYMVPAEVTVTLDDTSTTPLFADPTPALTALILPHPDNQGTIQIGYDDTDPQNQVPLSLSLVDLGLRYNLADLYVKASNAGDKVVVLYQNR